MSQKFALISKIDSAEKVELGLGQRCWSTHLIFMHGPVYHHEGTDPCSLS